MLTKRIAGGAALVLSLSAGLRLARGQLPDHMTPPTGGSLSATAAVTEPGAARAAYKAGKRATGDERRRYFSAGIAAARARLQVNPNDPEGLMWLAANMGSEALERGKLAALRVVPEMEKLLLRLEAVAPNFDHAAAARTLGRLYHKAPGFISIGSMKKARQYWELALSRAGDYPPNLILAADFFDDDGDEDRARQLAARYLQNPVSEQDPDAREWREIAERLVRQGGR